MTSSLIWVAPFALFLAAIAVLPLAAPQFWESNTRKLIVAVVLSVPVLAVYGVQHRATLLETGHDYLSFMILLGSLFVISAGVLLEGDLRATPAVNTVFLAWGAVLASAIGTTGASMLLIRPVLRTNSERSHVAHTIVFFIFIVSNIGGCLTPLGDPPLFLGYLQGVPFAWTFRLTPAWLTATVVLLAVYYVWDTRAYAKEPPDRLRADASQVEPLRIRGAESFAWLAAIIIAAAFLDSPWRELVMVAAAAMSYWRTARNVHEANHFSLHPMAEVAVVFAGIFVTMLPALDLLRERGGELGITAAWQFFWATGVLSSFLDNAPTYLTFLALAQGQGLAADVVGVPHAILAAISLGAVFMGANTYIGNAPNFMVRSIAESRGVKMPSFGGYMAYSGAVLMPLFVLLTFVFF